MVLLKTVAAFMLLSCLVSGNNVGAPTNHFDCDGNPVPVGNATINQVDNSELDDPFVLSSVRDGVKFNGMNGVLMIELQ